jgi:hypothetical protein
LDGYTLHDQARNQAVNPSDKIPPLKDYRNFPIATIAKELNERNDIETIYWLNGNYSFSYNTCSQPYKFWIEKHTPNYRYGQGCAEAALIIRNNKAYKAMTDCSDATLKQQLINNKQLAN